MYITIRRSTQFCFVRLRMKGSCCIPPAWDFSHHLRRCSSLKKRKAKTATTTTRWYHAPLMVPLDDGKRKRLAISRNYQLIIYVYAAVGAPGLLTPFAVREWGSVRRVYYYTFLCACEGVGVASRTRRLDGRRRKAEGSEEVPLVHIIHP